MTPEQLRTFAFDWVYRLPAMVERPDKNTPNPEKILAGLTTEQRDRALHVAARRLAFQLLYQLDAAATPATDEAAAELLSAILSHVDGLGPIALAEVHALTLGAYQSRAKADEEFLALAPEWPTNRLAAVDRAILRLAHFEMTATKIPPIIAINEAVELAKHYSTDKSPPFINGLLDKVLKRIDPTTPTPEPTPTL